MNNRLFLMACLLCALLAGCGGGGGDDPPPQKTPDQPTPRLQCQSHPETCAVVIG